MTIDERTMNMPTPIASSVELRRRVKAGWELWYVSVHPHEMPGRWELRFRNKRIPVFWEAIEQTRKRLDWWEKNTTEYKHGRDWCYLYRQSQLLCS